MDLTLTLAVHDLEVTAKYYQDVLGLAPERFVPLPGHPPVLLLRCGDATLLFRESTVVEALHPALFQSLERHPWGIGISLELSLTSLEKVRKAIVRHRLHPLYELDDEEFGRRELWLHDPDGYLLVLTEENPV